jgi:hypothetical protein
MYDIIMYDRALTVQNKNKAFCSSYVQAQKYIYGQTIEWK